MCIEFTNSRAHTMILRSFTQQRTMNHRTLREGFMTNTMKIPEVLRFLRISRSTLYKLIRNGEIESYTIGRSRFFQTTAVEAIQSKKSPSDLRLCR